MHRELHHRRTSGPPKSPPRRREETERTGLAARTATERFWTKRAFWAAGAAKEREMRAAILLEIEREGKTIFSRPRAEGVQKWSARSPLAAWGSTKRLRAGEIAAATVGSKDYPGSQLSIGLVKWSAGRVDSRRSRMTRQRFATSRSARMTPERPTRSARACFRRAPARRRTSQRALPLWLLCSKKRTSADAAQPSWEQEMRTFLAKLASIRKNEDPRMSFTTPEFRDSQRQFAEHFKARPASTAACLILHAPVPA